MQVNLIKLVIKLRIRCKSLWPDDIASLEGTVDIDSLTATMHGLQQLISEPTHLLPNLLLSITVFRNTWLGKTHYSLCYSANILKSDSHLPKIFFICFNESPLKLMKNAFNLMLKALFVLKITEFLSWLFGHVEKTVLSEL